MLRTLRIRNFKSIYRADLTFGNANLFLGPNGAGKSNVLEAVGMLAAALSRGLEPSSLDERGIRLSLPTMFKSAFKRASLPQTFRLEAEFDHGRYECSIRAGLGKSALEFHSEALYDDAGKVFGRGPNGLKLNTKYVPEAFLKPKRIDPNRGLWDVISPFAEISPSFRAELDDFSGFSIYAPQTAVMRGVAIDSRVKEPLGLTGAGLASAFSAALSTGQSNSSEYKRIEQILNLIWEPGWANEIRVGPFDPDIVPAHVKSDGALLYIRDRFMATKRNFLSAFDASEGTLYLIFVATLLAHVDTPRVFALDNVDGTLNPRLVRRLTDAIVEVCCLDERSSDIIMNNQQVFVTSHHPSSLDSFDLYREDQAIFVAHRDVEREVARGSTTFTRMRPPHNLSKDEWAARSEGRNLSALLLEGLIPDAL